MQSATGPVPTFDQFKTNLSRELDLVRPDQRDRLVNEIVKLAKRKVEMEEYAERFASDTRDSALKVRKSIANHKKMLTQLLKAIQSIDSAKAVGDLEDPEILKNFGVIAAQHELRMAAADILWVKDNLLPAMIHPQWRNFRERKTSVRFPEKVYPGAGVRSETISTQFIRAFNTSLNDFVAPNGGKVTVGRNRLIAKVLQVAFNDNRTTESIERTRNRKSK